MVSKRFKLEHLPDFDFSIRVIRSDSPDCREKKIHVEVVKTPSTALYARLSMHISARNTHLTELVHPWHEWMEQSCENRDAAIIQSEVITFTCQISWYRQMVSAVCYFSRNPQDDWRRYLLQKNYSDVKLIIGLDEIPAHRIVLASSSLRFKSMFASDPELDHVIVNHITCDVIRNVLTFMYTGWDKPMDDSDMALQMLFVADEYDIINLKARCEHKLNLQLTMSNVLELLEASVFNHAEKLNEGCYKFIGDHRRHIMNNPSRESTQLMHAYMQRLSIIH